jgi:hypothetical protein
MFHTAPFSPTKYQVLIVSIEMKIIQLWSNTERFVKFMSPIYVLRLWLDNNGAQKLKIEILGVFLKSMKFLIENKNGNI